ncbi:MAG: class I SAM-dependent methyltransferase [Chthoniobacteraceae bacterium]
MSESTFSKSDFQSLPVQSPGLSRQLVLHAFGQLSRGCLELILPDGSQRVFGTRGAEPSARLQIVREDFFRKCVLYGDVGFGEAYVDGDWETDSIERVISWVIHNIENSSAPSGSQMRALGLNLLQLINRMWHRLRPNNLRIARRNIAEHYDLGNEFYRLWLDETMTYSSAVFRTTEQSLEDAQHEKYEALCQHLRLQPGDEVLEIGCGWGGFASHAAARHGCRVTAITISQEQYDFAKARMEREGLSDRVSIRLQDYRLLEGQFDRIVSIEMMEALGDRYLKTFCAQVNRLLKPNGLVALQYITIPDGRHEALRRGVDWIQKHIFPGSLLLSIGRVSERFTRTGDLFLHHLQDHGPSYARTLQHWRRNFRARLSEVKAMGFDDRFIRKWDYYLQYCESAFAMRNISVVHAVYTRRTTRFYKEPRDPFSPLRLQFRARLHTVRHLLGQPQGRPVGDAARGGGASVVYRDAVRYLLRLPHFLLLARLQGNFAPHPAAVVDRDPAARQYCDGVLPLAPAFSSPAQCADRGIAVAKETGGRPDFMSLLGIMLVVTFVLGVLFAVLFLVCLEIRNFGFVDVAWSYGFIAVAALGLFLQPGWLERKLLIAAMVSLWSLRLGTHLFRRVLRHHPVEDGRYKALREEWGSHLRLSFFLFFEFQALLVVILGVPFLLTGNNPAPAFHPLELAAFALWGVAIVGEAMADWQMDAFKAGRPGGDQVCEGTLALLPASQLLLRVSHLVLLRPLRPGISFRLDCALLPGLDALLPLPGHRHSRHRGPGAAQ